MNQDLQLVSQGENQEVFGPFGRSFIGDFPTKGTLWIIVLAIVVDYWIAGGLLSFLLLSIISVYLAVYFCYNYIEPHFNSRIGMERGKKLSRITTDPNHWAMGDIGRLLHGYGKSAVGQVWDLSGKGSLREAFEGTGDDFSLGLEGDVERKKWKTWGLVILSWLCMIIAPLIFSIGTMIILLTIGLSEDMTYQIVGVLAYVLMFFIVIAFLYIDGRLDSFWKLFDIPPLKKTLVLVIFVSVIDLLLVIAYTIGYDFIAGPPENMELFYDPGSANNLLILALLFTVMSIGAPLVEEMFFRGYILDSLRRIHSDAVAIIASGLLFGIMHNPYFLFYGDLYTVGVASIGGFLYAWLKIRTGSLWPSIACHFLWNTTIFALMFA